MSDEPAPLTTREMCALLMISKTLLLRIAEQGFAETLVGRWPHDKTIQGYIKYLKSGQRRATKSASQSRVTDARAADIELRTKERARELVRFDDVVVFADTLVGEMLTEMSGIGPAITRDLALRNKIEDETKQRLGRVSASMAKHAAELRAGSGHERLGRPYGS